VFVIESLRLSGTLAPAIIVQPLLDSVQGYTHLTCGLVAHRRWVALKKPPGRRVIRNVNNAVVYNLDDAHGVMGAFK
jgi:hypothetical protein